MKKTKKLLLIPISITILTICSCSHSILTIHKYDGKQIVVNFLDRDSAFRYIQASNFAERMNRLNISLRIDEDLPEGDRNNELSVYKKFIYEHLKDWDGYERNIVWGALEDAIEKLKVFSPAIIPDTLFFINTSLRLEFNSFFTINKAICVPSSVVWPIFFNGIIKKTIEHELFHIYSRYNKSKRDSIYSLFNFFSVDTVNAGEYLQSKMINNPDVHSNNYVLRLKDSTGALKDLFLVVRLNEKKYNDNRGIISFLGATNIFDFFNPSLYELVKYEENSYEVKDKGNPVNLNWNGFQNEFDSTLGCLTGKEYFAEEIAAEYFIFCLKVDEDLELLEKCSAKDRDKIAKFLRIIRKQ